MALPNMGLKQSTVGSTLDPDWSINHEDNWEIIDEHDHITIGKKIVPEALNINEDLSMQGNNLIDLRSPIFQNLNSDPSNPTDLCSLYFKNGNLWLNNGSGGHVQVSNGAGLNVSTGVANLYTPVHIATSTTILNTDDYTYLEVETNTSINLFLPNASTVAGNRFYYIKDVTGLSGTNAITLVPTGGNLIDGSPSNYVMKRNWGSWLLVSDGVSKWYVSNFSNKEINDGTWNSVGYSMFIDSKSNGFSIRNSVANPAVSIPNSGGNTSLEVYIDAFLQGSNTIIGSTIGPVDQLTVYANADFKNNVILGSSSADTLTINATSTVASPITINAISTINADSTFNNNLTVLGNVQIGNSTGDTFNVTSTGNFFNDLTIGSDATDVLTVNSTTTYANDLTVLGNVQIGNSASDTFNITSNSSFANDVILGSSGSDTITVNGSASFLSSLTGFVGVNITGSSSLSGRVTSSGSGRISKRISVSSGTASYGPDTADIVLTSSAVSPAWTISDTNAVNGDVMKFSYQTGSGTATVNAPGPSLLTTLNSGEACEVARISGSWVLVDKY